MLASLKRAFPLAEIDWLVQDSFVDAIRAHPALGQAVRFPRTRLAAHLRKLNLGAVLGWLNTLRVGGYDMAIDCQGLLRSGIFLRSTEAARRIGFRNAREFGWLGANERHHVPESLHTVDRMLELIRLAGVEPVADMRLYTPEPERQAAAADPVLSAGRYVVLAPTTRWPAKLWPAERFLVVAQRILHTTDRHVILVGAASERDQCAGLLGLAAGNDRVIDRVGTSTIAQLMAIIERAALVVANDSAALHMAVGFDRPILGLFGPTRIDRVGPYKRDADVLQHVTPSDRLDHKDAAGRALMERITVEEVAARIGRRLGR